MKYKIGDIIVIDLLVTDLKKDEDEVIKEVNEILDKRNHDISLIEQELQRRYGEDIDENKIKNTVQFLKDKNLLESSK